MVDFIEESPSDVVGVGSKKWGNGRYQFINSTPSVQVMTVGID